MIELNHSPYLSQYKVTIVAEELLFKNHRLLILMCQTRALRTGVPKSTMLLFLLVLVCPSLSWRINSSPALSKMTTTSSLEISTGREHCQTTSCTEEGLFPEGGPDRMTWWHDEMMAWWHDDMMTWWHDDIIFPVQGCITCLIVNFSQNFILEMRKLCFFRHSRQNAVN